MIHDVAVAIRRLQRDDKIRTAMTVDCDVHHGNGTAAIFAGTRTESVPLPSVSSSTLNQKWAAKSGMRGAHAGDVFTISLHQHNNYPLWKPPSSIDVDLPDGTGDDDYLAWLDNALSSGLRQFEPDLLCYVAGADPYREDQLGGLNLTIEGLKKRDELVFPRRPRPRHSGDGDLRRRLCSENGRHCHHSQQYRHGGKGGFRVSFELGSLASICLRFCSGALRDPSMMLPLVTPRRLRLIRDAIIQRPINRLIFSKLARLLWWFYSLRIDCPHPAPPPIIVLLWFRILRQVPGRTSGGRSLSACPSSKVR